MLFGWCYCYCGDVALLFLCLIRGGVCLPTGCPQTGRKRQSPWGLFALGLIFSPKKYQPFTFGNAPGFPFLPKTGIAPRGVL